MIAIEKYSGDSDPILLTIIQFITTAVLFIILTGIKEGYEFYGASWNKMDFRIFSNHKAQ